MLQGGGGRGQRFFETAGACGAYRMAGMRMADVLRALADGDQTR
ncbi:hypothetical protein FB548_1736 [Pseudoxanthomonas sp. 3HH-4]|nr:hypothetical protein FB548_1736 [Pseudoxanthomonas sp. 3HH-4]